MNSYSVAEDVEMLPAVQRLIGQGEGGLLLSLGLGTERGNHTLKELRALIH